MTPDFNTFSCGGFLDVFCISASSSIVIHHCLPTIRAPSWRRLHRPKPIWAKCLLAAAFVSSCAPPRNRSHPALQVPAYNVPLRRTLPHPFEIFRLVLAENPLNPSTRSSIVPKRALQTLLFQDASNPTSSLILRSGDCADDVTS